MREGLGLLTWERDGFGYAESYDEAAGRYRGLRARQHAELAGDDLRGLLVKPEVTQKQLEAEGVAPPPGAEPGEDGAPRPDPDAPPGPTPPPGTRPTRYHGSIELDAQRVVREIGTVAEEVIQHLTALVGAEVKITLEIEAEMPDGAPDQVVRVVTENSRTLTFRSSGFESE